MAQRNHNSEWRGQTTALKSRKELMRTGEQPLLWSVDERMPYPTTTTTIAGHFGEQLRSRRGHAAIAEG